ncbi:hypothetical protein ACIREO_14155 [Streptomyces sp. NPDC102441]|uniref:hypothetical protein n=1 Tax=Streptomyces sp. NPDC102441 TaxID=3366176 RepID=UPI0038300FEF
MMNPLFAELEKTLHAARMTPRPVAEAFAALIDKHRAAENLDEREADALRSILYGSLLDPFAETDPEWTQAFRPKIAGYLADGTPVMNR